MKKNEYSFREMWNTIKAHQPMQNGNTRRRGEKGEVKIFKESSPSTAKQ